MELWFKVEDSLMKQQEFDNVTLRSDGSLMLIKQGEIQAIYERNAKKMFDNILKYMDCGIVILENDTHEIIETEKIKAINNLTQNETKCKNNISAMQFFESLGYLLLEDDEYTLGFIHELKHNKYATEYVKVIFDKKNKEYSVYTLTVKKDDTRYINVYDINYYLNKAIQKQIEELHWYE